MTRKLDRRLARQWVLYGEGDECVGRPIPGETFRTRNPIGQNEHDSFIVLGITSSQRNKWRAMILSPALGYRTVDQTSGVWKQYERFTPPAGWSEKQAAAVQQDVDDLLDG